MTSSARTHGVAAAGIALGLMAAGRPSPATAQAPATNPLVGTWSLVSTIITNPDGTMRPDPQVGPTPKGYMIYGDANRMCAQFTNPARPQWRSTAQPTYDELKSMTDFMGAYCSRYEVNVAEG